MASFLKVRWHGATSVAFLNASGLVYRNSKLRCPKDRDLRLTRGLGSSDSLTA